MAQYKTGSVSVTNGSQTVTGLGTLWSSEVSSGDIFTVVGENAWYEVGSVDSDTQITLSASYAGVSASGAAYAITRDFTTNYGWPYPQKGDIETASLIKRAFEDIDSKLVLTNTDGDVTVAGDITLSAGTANGVAYLNGSKVLTSGSALTFDGTTLTNTGNTRSASLKSTGRIFSTGDTTYDDLGSSKALFMSYDSTSDIGYLTARDYPGSTNVPLYISGSDIRFGAGANGSEAMRLTSTGLGIGTSSPGYPLEVRKDQNAGTKLGVQNQNSGASALAGIDFQAYGGGWQIEVPASTTFVNPLRFSFNGSERACLDSSGNLGLGVTPSAWGATFPTTQVGYGAALTARSNKYNEVYLGANAYHDGATGWRYIGTDYATNYYQYNGQHVWRTAPSGTAGNAISFTQIGTLDASGLMIGRTNRQNGGTIEALGTGTQAFVAQVTNNGNSLFQGFNSSGSATFYVVGSGGIYSTSTSITAISDITLKENIRELETGLTEVMALRPRRFDWKNGDAKDVAGFIAQEVEQVLPDLVADYQYSEGVLKKSLKMGDILPTLVKAIQELKAEFDAYKAAHP